MDAIVAALDEEQAELAALLSSLDERDWQRPSRCEGWTVADVMLHLAQTNELAVESIRGRFAEALDEVAGRLGSGASVDEGADLMVAAERGAPPSFVLDRWQRSADRQREGFAACEPHQRLLWVTGELSARTEATTRLAETWIHAGDVYAGLDRVAAPTDRLWHVARLAWRTLPYAFSVAGRELSGPVAFELRAPGGDAWDFVSEDAPQTTIRGDAAELCLVAARRVDAVDTGLRGDGPDAAAVLELVRTYA